MELEKGSIRSHSGELVLEGATDLSPDSVIFKCYVYHSVLLIIKKKDLNTLT